VSDASSEREPERDRSGAPGAQAELGERRGDQPARPAHGENGSAAVVVGTNRIATVADAALVDDAEFLEAAGRVSAEPCAASADSLPERVLDPVEGRSEDANPGRGTGRLGRVGGGRDRAGEERG
jgi:hypothetical protein